MRALTVIPEQAGSAEVTDIAEPDEAEGSVLVETLAVGICGTDMEIVGGGYGWAPPGHERLVLGHESLGRVVGGPLGVRVRPGRPRRRDRPPAGPGPLLLLRRRRVGRVPQRSLHRARDQAAGRLHARAATATNPDALVKVDRDLGELGVLLEPTTVVAKAWEQAEKIGNRATWKPGTAVIVGAGPIGLLAALLGVQRGLEVHVIDQMTTGLEAGPRGRPRGDLPRREGGGGLRGPGRRSWSAPASPSWSPTRWPPSGREGCSA